MFSFFKKKASVAPVAPASRRNSGSPKRNDITLRYGLDIILNQPVKLKKHKDFFEKYFKWTDNWFERGPLFFGVPDQGPQREPDVNLDFSSLDLQFWTDEYAQQKLSVSINMKFTVRPGDTRESVYKMFKQGVDVWAEKSASQIVLPYKYRIDSATLFDIIGLDVLPAARTSRRSSHRTRRSKRN